MKNSNPITVGDYQYEISDQSPKNEGDYFLWISGRTEKQEVFKFHSDAGYGIRTWDNYNRKNGSSLIVNWSGCRGLITATNNSDLNKQGVPELKSVHQN